MDEPIPPDEYDQLIVGLVPWIGQQLADFRRDRYQLEMWRMRQVSGVTAEAADLSPEELLQRVAGDDRLADLLLKAMEAARRTGVDAKLTALGRAVASGALARDDADVDEAELLIRTLDDIGAAEIRRLEQLSVDRAPTRHSRLVGPFVGDEPPPSHWAIDASLERHGLIRRGERATSGRLGGGSVRTEFTDVTTYGARLLALLADAGSLEANVHES